MKVKKAVDFNTDQNCYIIYNENSKKCIVIDPANSYEKVIKIIKDEVLEVSAIFLTHCHYDHISSVMKLKEFSNALVYASEECRENVKNSGVNVSIMFGENFEYDCVDKVLGDGDLLIDDITIKVIKTPGHTNCSICFIIENNIFTGDTLFLRTTGRWDLPTGNYKHLEKSIKEKLYSLDDDMIVFPGHGEETTIGYEKKFNMVINA